MNYLSIADRAKLDTSYSLGLGTLGAAASILSGRSMKYEELYKTPKSYS